MPEQRAAGQCAAVVRGGEYGQVSGPGAARGATGLLRADAAVWRGEADSVWGAVEFLTRAEGRVPTADALVYFEDSW